MKNILSILLFLVCLHIAAYSQDKEPSQHPFTMDGSPYYLSTDSSKFSIDRFAWGFIWSGDYRINTKLGFNTEEEPVSSYSGATIKSPDEFISNTDYIFQIPGLSWHGSWWCPFNTLSYQYEPTLLIPDENRMYTRELDPTNPVFGFMHIDTNITITDTDTRLKLYKAGTYTNPVIKNPWINDRYFVTNVIYKDDDSIITEITQINPLFHRQYNGREFFVNINLRRLDSTDLLQNDSIVLKLTLPYHEKTKDTWDTIKFSYTPSTVINDTTSIISTLGEYRGTLRDTVINDLYPKEIVITKKMIPTNCKDITISAFFELKIPNINNPPLNGSTTPRFSERIDKILMDISYYNSCDIGIDFISITTPAARYMMFGVFDSLLTTKVQRVIDTINTSGYKNKGIKFKRVYLRDEQGTQGWGTARYFTKLIGNIGISQDGSHYASLLSHYTKEPITWNEVGAFSSYSNAPYFRYNQVGADKIIQGYKYGYDLYNVTTTRDTLNSEYETYPYAPNPNYSGNYDSIRVCSDSIYDTLYINPKISPQMFFEEHLNSCFSGKPCGLNLYGPGNFWYESFTGIFEKSIRATGDTIISVSTNRPLTGEELRLLNWNAIIFGAKGLFFDREETTVVPRDKIGDLIVVGFGNGKKDYDAKGLTLDSFDIWKDNIGGDFLDLENDYTTFQYYIDTNDILLTGISPNRVYLGRKSYRTETKKLTDLTRALDTTENSLMKLSLQAAYMHGYKIFKHQHPKYDTSSFILNKFIQLESIRTKKIAQPNIDSLYTFNLPYEDTVKSFYNLTLLSSVDDTNMTGKFMIGVVNRRTDPLIFWDWDSAGTTNHYMRFISTAEFEDSCHTGRDSLKFQNMFWKRLGCREIHIPFKFRNGTNVNKYTLLKITELGNCPFMDTLSWRQPKYYHRIDTLIQADSTLVVRLLPGEGKILKVQVINIAESPNDSCAGCAAITENLDITISDRICNNGECCWNVNIENTGDCYYPGLSIIMNYFGEDLNDFSINTPPEWSGQYTSLNGNEYYVLTGDLLPNSAFDIQICTDDDNEMSYQFVIGEIVDGSLIVCDEPLTDTVYVSPCCDDNNITISEDQVTCGCNQCGYLVSGNILKPDSCFSHWAIKVETNGELDTLIDNIPIAPNGDILQHICLTDGNHKFFIFIKNNDDIICSREFERTCVKCDSIEVKKHYSKDWWQTVAFPCKGAYDIFLNNMSDCIDYIDFVEVGDNGDTTLTSNIPTNASDSIYHSFEIPIGVHNYKFIFKDADGNILCESEIIYKSCGLICSDDYKLDVPLSTSPPFCCGDFTLQEIDSSSCDIYGITIVDPRNPNILLYLETRDPSSEPPFDLSMPGKFLSSICVPIDSALYVDVCLYNADTLMVAGIHYDSSCVVQPQNYEYIESLSIYPNPADNSIVNDYELRNSAFTQIEVYDHRGNELARLVRRNQNRGRYYERFNTANLRNGLYYIVLRANNEYMIQSVIIMH